MVKDNKIWISLKEEVNGYQIGDQMKLIMPFSRFFTYSPPTKYHYVKILVKLKYIDKPSIKIEDNYIKLKNIPDDLIYKDALILSKNIKMKSIKGRHKDSTWNKIIKGFNFVGVGNKISVLEHFGYDYNGRRFLLPTIKTYISLLDKLGYIEKIIVDDKKRYIVNKLIPDDLSVSKAKYYLYNIAQKRKRKILLLKEKYTKNE